MARTAKGARLARRRLSLTGVAAAGMIVASSGQPIAAVAVDGTGSAPAPTVVVLRGPKASLPTPAGMTLPARSRLTLRGTAYARTAVPLDRIAAVRVTVRNPDAGTWLQKDGTFAATPATSRVTVRRNVPVTVDGVRRWSAPWAWTPPGQPWAAPAAAVLVVDVAAEDRGGDVESPAQRLHTGISAPASAGRAFLTLRFARTTWQQYADARCSTPVGGTTIAPDGTPVTGEALTLAEVAARMQAIDPRLFGVGNIVTGRTRETTRACIGRIAHASWEDIAALRRDRNWRFNSAGIAYDDLSQIEDWSQPVVDRGGGETGAPAADMTDEVCGAARVIAAHGYPEAYGAFAYPNDAWSDRLQRDLVSTCYLFGRTYQGLSNVRGVPVLGESRTATGKQLWYSRTVDVTGGACRREQPGLPLPFPPATPCTGHPVQRDGAAEWPTCEAREFNGNPANIRALTYPDVDCLRAMVASVGRGQWLDLQIARVVTGASFGGTITWDCRSTDWRDHWTSQGELICWDDYASILASIGRHVTIADPVTVAAAWGRALPPAP